MMANAKECDICKKFYKPKGDEENLDMRIVMNSHLIDLCPSCQLELEKWYKSKKERAEK